ncbi:MAG: helix-turn-helix domain-containing protein [Anaerolineae bacterium]|nr:helix-turn-helix domain-containing protein [Anaerolineae bacterium]
MDDDRQALRDQARRLRQQGHSLNEIARMIGVSNTTILRWVRDVELTPEQTTQLQKRWGAHSISKPEARAEARRLRRDHGMSIKDICRRLGVSKSSVSLWVRDIPLTDAQVERLEQKQIVQRNQHHGARSNYEKHLAIRRAYQEEGRAQAREGNLLHQAGCMLYWAEGSKDRTSLTFVNSDPDMVCFYVRFLREGLGLSDGEFSIRIYCYDTNGIAVDDIERYWLGFLDLDQTALKKTVVNKRPRSSQQKRRKLMYGVCSVRVHSVRWKQHVYGAIQEYAGIDKPDWLL